MDIMDSPQDNGQQSRLFQQQKSNSIENYNNYQERLLQQKVTKQRRQVFFKNIKNIKIFYWLAAFLFVAALVYFRYSNQLSEKDYQSMMKKKKNSNQKQGEQLKKNQTNGSELIYKNLNYNPQFQLQVINPVELKSFPQNEIPRYLWYFSNKNLKDLTIWTQKCLINYKNKAKNIGFDIIILQSNEYQSYIQKNRYLVIQQQIKSLDMRYQGRTQPQIIRYRDLIMRQLIILQLLIQNGGMYIDQDIILTEDLVWINNINTNQHINARQWINQAQFIGFHSIQLSPHIKKQIQIKTDLQIQKYALVTPTISSYFFAAVKNCEFLKDLRTQYYRLLASKQNINQLVQQENLFVNFEEKNVNFYKNLFQIASQITLMKRHLQLKNSGEQALKFYQIATINQKFGPTKLQTFFKEAKQKDVIFKHLSLFTWEQLQYQFGKIKYMIKLQPVQIFQDLLLESINHKQILRNSLIHQCLLHSNNQNVLLPDKIQQFKNKETWNSLPAKIWTYNKYLQSNLMSQIWRKYTRVVANQSKFQFIILNQKNLAQYLPKEAIQKIRQAITSKDNKLRINQRTKMEMISLAVLYEHGGVWIDPQIFLVSNLQWLRNINLQPHIWNKNGKLPKVVLVFHPYYGPPFEWKQNKQGIKQAWHLGYQKSFIAAQPQSQLLKNWLEEYIANLKYSFFQITNKFYECRITSGISIVQTNHQLLVLDTLKCVLGSKKVDLLGKQQSLSPVEYYGLWAINGFTTYLKIGESTNFIEANGTYYNPLVWRYSFDQMEHILGKIYYLTRINHQTISKIEQLCKDNLENMSNEFHKSSFFMKLLERINQTIVSKNNKLYLQADLQELEQSKRAKGKHLS